MKNSFVMYTDYLEHIELLTDEQCGILFKTIMNYAADIELPDNIDAVTKMAFSFIKKQMDRDNEKKNFGKNHWNWKGGITDKNRAIRESARYKDFRNTVLKRDSYKCQKCGSNQNLNVHHIYKFSEYKDLRFDYDNGITLCQKCHKEVHKNER